MPREDVKLCRAGNAVVSLYLVHVKLCSQRWTGKLGSRRLQRPEPARPRV